MLNKNCLVLNLLILLILIGFCIYIILFFNIGGIGPGVADMLAKSSSDTWMITGFSEIRDLTSIDNLLFFQAYRADRSVDCFCIYAADISTGEIVWSTESLAIPHIEEYRQNNPNSIDIAAEAEVLSISDSKQRMYLRIRRVFYVLNIHDGSVVWGSGLGDFYNSSIQITEREVFLVNENQNLIAFDVDTGRILWEEPTNKSENSIGRLDLQNSMLYESVNIANQDYLVALHQSDGMEKWRIAIRKFNYSLLFFENEIIYSNFDDWGEPVYVTAVDAETGSLVWEEEFLGTYDYPDLKIIGGQVFLRLCDKEKHNEYTLYSIDPVAGDVIWVFNDDLQNGQTQYIVKDEVVFILTSSEGLYSLDRLSGDILWNSTLSGEPIYFF